MRELEKEYDPAMLRAYERYEKAEHDYISGINGARRESHSKGLREGQQKQSLEIARNLKAMGLPLEQIMQGTGLTAEEIQKL